MGMLDRGYSFSQWVYIETLKKELISLSKSNKESIEKRQEMLLNLAKRIWSIEEIK